MNGVPAWAHVGAKVICVDDTDFDELREHLVKDRVYTISGFTTGGRLVGFRLAEVHNAISRFGVEFGYNVERFRPVVERKSDNEIEATLYHLRGLKVTGSVRSKERA